MGEWMDGLVSGWMGMQVDLLRDTWMDGQTEIGMNELMSCRYEGCCNRCTRNGPIE